MDAFWFGFMAACGAVVAVSAISLILTIAIKIIDAVADWRFERWLDR